MGIMFAPDMLAAVLEGRKTQTRRRVKDNQIESFATTFNINCLRGCDYIEVVHETGTDKYGLSTERTKWRVGKNYAAQPGRGKKSVGRILITAIRKERFCDISQADAVAEGFDNPAGFFAKIRELYGDDFDLTQPCWILEFRLV